MINKLKRYLRPYKWRLQNNPDAFLAYPHLEGVIHIGANTGHERDLYESLGLSVIWVEADLDVFRKLSANISKYPRQIAFNALMADEDNKEYDFHCANNNSLSSSIHAFSKHKDIWPSIEMVSSRKLKSMTLPTLLSINNINTSKFKVLVLDTQGSEYLVLKGSIPILSSFKFIKVEVADFEAYQGGCQLKDIDAFMVEFGYSLFHSHRFAQHPLSGAYFDNVYKRSHGD